MEYKRRQEFAESMKSMGRSEYIELARILRKHQVPISENHEGILINLAKLPQSVFDDMVKFREFVTQNNMELHKRDLELATLSQMTERIEGRLNAVHT